ncbi:hypothetical protein SAMN05216350_107124 [Polaromonas sp. YR568]|nr:hypothetical protein SAMN05216350_107124 [Polaromonas sp. YR568]
MLAAAALAPAGTAWAQSFCASDGQPKPVQLLERFINADCDTCWADPATPKAAANQLAIDWVLPGSKGDDAPLSAVAAREALARLAVLGKTPPAQSLASTQPVTGLKGATLRVAHGLPLNGYLGTSIELKPIPAAAKGRQWTAWLALVETLPAGAENSPVERNLIRNVLQTTWDGRKPLSKGEQNRFFDGRSMSIAEGANPERMRVVGWVEDDKGQVRVAAESRCGPPQK